MFIVKTNLHQLWLLCKT